MVSNNWWNEGKTKWLTLHCKNGTKVVLQSLTDHKICLIQNIENELIILIKYSLITNFKKLPSNALNRNIRPKSEHVFLNRNKVNIRHMQLFNWKLKPLPLLLNQYWLWEVFFLQIIQRLTELESKRIFRISRQFFVTETLRPAPWILVIAI